tara:strand:+ start:1252 stop:1881 length:630 start_codon:yes stop_codon:yes gene_type:complete
MAITYPLSTPTNKTIASITLVARNVIGVSTSPFNFKQQVYQYSGQRWEADITLPRMAREDAEQWVAFLMSLYGQKGTFLLGDPLGGTARGSASTAAGTPVVNGASQTGGTLNIDGLPASATGYLKAGDYIQLGSAATSQLYKVLADADSNGSGEASLDIYPNLRSSPADGATVVVSNAKGLFRLASNETSWNINNLAFYGITFGAVESL